MSRGDKKESILEAAGRVFSNRQFHEVTMDDVAKAAKVSKGTIYLYFKDKEDLFFQVAAHGFDGLFKRIQQNVPEDAPFEERLRTACNQMHLFFESRRPIRRSLMEHAGRAKAFSGRMKEAWREHRKKVDVVLGAILREGMEQGHIDSDVQPENLARLLLGFMGGRAHMFEEEPQSAPPVDVVVDIFLDGIRTREPALTTAGQQGASE